MEMGYYEDVEIGATDEFGEYEVTQAEIVGFAEQYDPQPFHVDPEAAKDSFFGELVASGWHTASMTMRMIVDNYLNETDGVLGAAGVEELRWTSPVKPGYVLHVESEFVDKEPWRPGVGIVITDTRTLTDDGTEVMSMTSRVMHQRREIKEQFGSRKWLVFPSPDAVDDVWKGIYPPTAEEFGLESEARYRESGDPGDQGRRNERAGKRRRSR